MANPARPLPTYADPAETIDPRDIPASTELRRANAPLPILMNAHQLASAKENLTALSNMSAANPLRYVPPHPKPQPESKADQRAARKDSGVLRGIKDLQQLQKQTLAVLESVKSTLDDISQVLRSPEATRGLEKQQNAATLLAKGFARDAVEQSTGAVALLPANPEAHLLLSLSLAADQQLDNALIAARKGLALFDRRTHPLAIEAGLLHALAALGCGPEAAERWALIIENLPIPVLLEHLGRIAACFPGDAPDGHLDELVTRRLTRDTTAILPASLNRRARMGLVETRPGEIPAPALFAGLDAAHFAKLPNAHRAILGQVARRLNDASDATELLRFLIECVIPLGNIGLDRSAGALGRATVKRLLRLHADAMTLHRGLEKLIMAGATAAARELAQLLDHWRREGAKLARARHLLALAGVMVAGGAACLVYPVLTATYSTLIIPSASGVVAGAVVGVIALMGRTWSVELPHARAALTPEELRFLRSGAVKATLRASLLP